MNFIRLDELNVINAYATDFFTSIHSPFLTKFFLVLTDIGNPVHIALYCLVLVMVMWLHKKYEHIIQFCVTIGVSAMVAYVTKILVQLPRPPGGVIQETGYSFASAHAMIAVVFCVLVIYAYKNHFQNIWGRRCFVFLLSLACVCVGLSRVYLGVHYMTDVLAGALIGLIIACISIVMHERHWRNN
ncbi:MAG: hypothetical protein QG568_235 [Patescibacteria group bacterium]|nr:hypothetical protein [Patescibacteria group bacterium]